MTYQRDPDGGSYQMTSGTLLSPRLPEARSALLASNVSGMHSADRCHGSLVALPVALVVAGVALTSAAWIATSETSAAASTSPVYDVALGDSLAWGVGATSPATSYVGLLYHDESAAFPGLQLQNLSCPGATTTSMIQGPSCGSNTSQLATAEALLGAHQGQIAFVTIDIGANDVDGCATSGGINSACFNAGIQAIATNLPAILSGLKTADPGVQVFGMNYYDPFLAAWLDGPTGEQLARQSLTDLDTLNTTLLQDYSAAGFPTADVATQFDSDNFALTGTYNSQTLPQNVANICNWTLMCTSLDIHANDVGHAQLADAFLKVLPFPTTTTTTTEPISTTTTTTSGVATAAKTGSISAASTSSSSDLAFTGPGRNVWVTGLAGALLVLLGAGLLLVGDGPLRLRRWLAGHLVSRRQSPGRR